MAQQSCQTMLTTHLMLLSVTTNILEGCVYAYLFVVATLKGCVYIYSWLLTCYSKEGVFIVIYGCCYKGGVFTLFMPWLLFRAKGGVFIAIDAILS